VASSDTEVQPTQSEDQMYDDVFNDDINLVSAIMVVQPLSLSFCSLIFGYKVYFLMVTIIHLSLSQLTESKIQSLL